MSESPASQSYPIADLVQECITNLQTTQENFGTTDKISHPIDEFRLDTEALRLEASLDDARQLSKPKNCQAVKRLQRIQNNINAIDKILSGQGAQHGEEDTEAQEGGSVQIDIEGLIAVIREEIGKLEELKRTVG
jgi:hypothetical protein